MKQFDLSTYLRLKEEGEEPKIVTRRGRSARIICTDRKDPDACVVALVNECGVEVMNPYHKDGRYLNFFDHALDLFFADPEPTYRPYKDAEECFKEVSKHGMLVRGSEDECYYLVSTISDRHVWLGTGQVGTSMKNLLRDFLFIDGSPCGVKED